MFEDEDSLDEGSTPIDMTIACPNPNNVVSDIDTPLSAGTSKREHPNFIINSVENYIDLLRNFQEHDLQLSGKINVKNDRERSNTDLSKSTHANQVRNYLGSSQEKVI